jgi:hypothetical protein
MTKAEIRAIWEKAPGFIRGGGYDDKTDCQCAANTVWDVHPVHTGPFDKAGLGSYKVIDANDRFTGTPQERRDHMIALLDAGKLDA